MGRLEGKVAIITGAARGQGASHARRFVAEGARVVIGDVGEEDGTALAAELGPSARFVRLDVADEGSWRAALELTHAELGPPTVLVNNAAIVEFVGLLEQSREAFQRVLDVNLVGPWLGIKIVAPAIAAAGGGSIVNVGSTAAFEGYSGVGAYAASKWGLRGLTKSAAVELGPRGIRVNAVHPGAIATTMLRGDHDDASRFAGQPISRAGRPEEVTNMVVYLASDEASYSTGGDFVVDGGVTAGGLPPSARRS
jgi:3alpha(or 20beta)-hydroxysteroid dehydrogenase